MCEEHAGIMEASVIYLEAMDAQPCPTIGTPLPSPSIQATTSKKPKSAGEPPPTDLTNPVPTVPKPLQSWCPCSLPETTRVEGMLPVSSCALDAHLQNMPDGCLRPFLAVIFRCTPGPVAHPPQHLQ